MRQNIHFGPLLNARYAGEQVLIQVEGSQELLSLRSVPAELPADYLAGCYGPEEIAQENYLGSRAPRGIAT